MYSGGEVRKMWKTWEYKWNIILTKRDPQLDFFYILMEPRFSTGVQLWLPYKLTYIEPKKLQFLSKFPLKSQIMIFTIFCHLKKRMEKWKLFYPVGNTLDSAYDPDATIREWLIRFLLQWTGEIRR